MTTQCDDHQWEGQKCSVCGLDWFIYRAAVATRVEKQLADALAQVRQLRDAMEFYAGLNSNSWKAREVLVAPAPRVFTAEEVRPLLRALEFAAQDLCGSESEALSALDHARKLGMEDA